MLSQRLGPKPGRPPAKQPTIICSWAILRAIGRATCKNWGSVDLRGGVSGPETKKSEKKNRKSLLGEVRKVQKVSKRSEKSPKTHIRLSFYFLDLFGTFSGPARPQAGKAPGDFLRLFGFGPETPSPRSGPRNLDEMRWDEMTSLRTLTDSASSPGPMTREKGGKREEQIQSPDMAKNRIWPKNRDKNAQTQKTRVEWAKHFSNTKIVTRAYCKTNH